MTSTASELTWIKQLLTDLHIDNNEPMKMFCDNQVTRHIAANLIFHERIKHIEVDYHFIQEKIQVKEIKTPFVKSGDQLADIFTKELYINAFENITYKLGLYDIYNTSLRGNVENKND